MAITIPEFLYNIPILDICILVSLLIALAVGIFNGAIRKICRICFITILFVVLYFTFIPFLADWIEYYSFSTFNFVLSFTYQDVTFKVYSIHDLFVLIQNLNIDSEILVSYCSALTKSIAVIVCLPIILFLSTPFTWIIFDCGIKRAIVKKIKKKKGIVDKKEKVKYKPKWYSRLLGGLLGVIEWSLIAYIYTQPLGIFTSGLSEVIIPSLVEGQDLYTVLINSFNMEASNINLIHDLLLVINNGLNPGNTFVFKYLVNGEQGIWLAKGVKTITEGDETNIVPSSIQDTIKELYSTIIERLKDLDTSSTSA